MTGRWPLPGRPLCLVLLVHVVAVAVVAHDAVIGPVGLLLGTVTVSVPLVLGDIVQNEIALRRRIRPGVDKGQAYIDFSSVWTFAAALILPPVAASAVVIGIYAYRCLRPDRRGRPPLYRQTFTASAVLLSVHAAAATTSVLGFMPGSPHALLTVIAAMLAYTVVNMCLVLGVMALSSSDGVRAVLGHGDDVLVEVSTLCLGALAALAMVSAGPLLALTALPPLLVLHQAKLVRRLATAATTDGKTGLLNPAAWHQQAAEQLRLLEGGGSAALLILDLDHFKRINDEHGHLAGDVVLSNVAAALREEVRDHDLVGRFGGEEFVILLPRSDDPTYHYHQLHRIAERIRRSIELLAVEVATPEGPLTITGVTVSIGGAVAPQDGWHLQDLVATADAALYGAKRAGRNRVRLGRHTGSEVPRP